MAWRFALGILVFVFLSHCARVGRPTGGAQDTIPPISISATPDFKSLHFKGNKIKIYFDEYIKLKDLNKQLVISPPLDYIPEIIPLGTASKHITIKIKDTLRENTTYTFNFGNAIVDNSEGNPLEQFKYLFSTGDYIDSLKIEVVVKDAYNKEVAPNISVMLYAIDSTYNDSIIYKRKPNYVANTLDTTFCSITNIKEGKYFLFALNDVSNNLVFNPKEDQIGYMENPIDVSIDSSYQLVLFKEEPAFRIKKPEEISKNHLVVGYEGSPEAAIHNVTDKNKQPVLYKTYRDRVTDSLHIWYRDVNTDTLFVEIQHKDSLTSYPVKRRTKDIDSLDITKNISSTLHLRDSLFILSNIPIETIDDKKISLIDKDSVGVAFYTIKDPINDKFQIAFEKKENNNYSLSLFPSAVTDFLGHTNDTISYSFNTKSEEDYGEIILKVKNTHNTPIIIDLITTSERLIERSYINTDKTLNFPFLLPEKYTFRAIYDTNDNKKWDTGNFLQKKRSERTQYFSKEIEVRANSTYNEELLLDNP